MGTRLDKFRTLNGLARPAGALTPANRCRASGFGLLAEDSNPGPLLAPCASHALVSVRGPAGSLALRSNGVDCNLLSGIFDLREYQGPGCASRRILDLGETSAWPACSSTPRIPKLRLWRWKRSRQPGSVAGELFVSTASPAVRSGAAVADQPGKATFFLGPGRQNSSFVRPAPWIEGRRHHRSGLHYCSRNPVGSRMGRGSTC